MAKDYYQLLGSPRDAEYSTICEAYRTLAIEWHPLKHPGDQFHAFQRFNDIAEAFDVLSHSTPHTDERKTAYDQLGEYGLKNGVADGTGGLMGGYTYSGDAYQIFNAFFGTKSPFANTVDSKSYPEITEGYIQAIYGSELKKIPPPQESPPEDLIVPISCTLIELYNGCKKSVSYTRRVLNRLTSQFDGQTNTIEVEVRKGHYEDMVRLGEGHESFQHATGRLVLRIVEQPHPQFLRKNHDLVLTITISLLDALLAHPISFVPITQTTLDNRVLSLSFDEVISPKTRKYLSNEGMPLPLEFDFADSISKVYGMDKHSPARGRLIVKFSIQFPKYVPEQEKEQLRVALLSH